MTTPGGPTSSARRGSRAQANQEKILEPAARELAQNPAASMEEIASAVGVVRRTLYAHFPTRESLIDGILDLASNDIAHTLRPLDSDEPVAVTFARMTIALWRVGDKYRLLLKLSGTNMGAHIQERLAPVHEHGTGILRRGQEQGAFSDHLPAAILSRAIAGLILALLEASNTESWAEPEPEVAVARACLITLGIAPADADGIAKLATAAEGLHATPGSSGERI